jgi:hypothetical protein
MPNGVRAFTFIGEIVMGLDISFSKAKALEAGMVLEIKRRGSLRDIAELKALPVTERDPEYLKYLLSPASVATIFCGISRGSKSFEIDGYADETLFVRANKWGNLYAPLTEWLIANHITWDET